MNATYNYFYGKYLCALFRKYVSPNETSHLFKQYETAINRFNEIIANKCWDFNKKISFNENSDESINSDTFCCLLLLQELSPTQLFYIVLEKRKSDINECFDEQNDLKKSLHSFINILFNTIKCIHSVFFNKNGSKFKPLLHQRYERFTKISYESPVIRERVLSHELTSEITGFKLKNGTTIELIDNQIIKNETKNWINSIKSLIEPLLKNLLENIDSVNYICSVLTEIDKSLKQSQKLIDWEEYCEELMGIYVSIWDEFAMDYIISRITSIINEKINKSLNSLKENIQNSVVSNNSLNINDLEVINIIWEEFDTNSLNLTKKSMAQISMIDKFCSDFDDSLRDLLIDIKVIKDNSSQLIKSQNLNEIEVQLLNSCQTMINELKEFLDSMNGSTDSETVTIFCAQFLRQMTQSCPHLAQCFENSSNTKQYSWTKAKDLLLSFSYNYYKKWFDLIVNKIFGAINCDSFTSLDNFINNSFVWDKIEITEESEDGKLVTSMIEVPLQISSVLHNNLSELCTQINRIAGHTLPRTVAINILSTLTNHLTRIYGNAYESLINYEYPQNIKQTIALQMYFDLLFFKQFLGTSRDEHIKQEEMPKIQQLFQKFETFIDPFDLHVFFPHIQTNIAKIGKTSSVIFGLLLPDNSFVITDSKAKQSYQNNEPHNILPLNSCQKPFTLLNVNSISTKISKKRYD